MMDKIITDKEKLRLISRPTTWEEVNDLKLVDRLKKACDTAWTNGTGLAAIQIGVPIRFAWFRWGTDDFYLLNPEILELKGEEKLTEGCLSIPDKWFQVNRYYKIKYISDDQKLKAKGFKAQIIQHEIDHMNGILINERGV